MDQDAHDGGRIEVFDAMTRWVAKYRDKYKIAFVLHVGDITQDTDDRDVSTEVKRNEWARARRVMANLHEKRKWGRVSTFDIRRVQKSKIEN